MVLKGYLSQTSQRVCKLGQEQLWYFGDMDENETGCIIAITSSGDSDNANLHSHESKQ